MEVHVEHLGAVQFEIKARQHTIACDQPEALGGFDEGMTPPELLLSALASCAAYYAVAYLKKKGLAAPGTRVSVSADKVQNPARMDNFKIALSVPIDLSEENRAGLEAGRASLPHPQHPAASSHHRPNHPRVRT